MTAYVLGLGEGGEIEVQMFNLAQMFIRIPNVQFSTKAPLLPNPCWWLAFFYAIFKLVILKLPATNLSLNKVKLSFFCCKPKV